MVGVLAQSTAEGIAIGGAGVTILGVAGLLIKRGFQFKVGNGNGKTKPEGDEFNLTICNERHTRIDGRLRDMDAKLDRLVEHLIKPRR